MSLLLTVTLVGCNTAPAEAPAETAAEPAAETKPESTGKRCYGFKNDARSVELDMELNPLIAGCFIRIFSDLNADKLFASLEEYLKENEL